MRANPHKGPPSSGPVCSTEYEFVREVLVSAREKAGLSQAELARRVGRPPSDVVLMETGELQLELRELFQFLNALELDWQTAAQAMFSEFVRFYPEPNRCSGA